MFFNVIKIRFLNYTSKCNLWTSMNKIKEVSKKAAKQLDEL